jgi:hypothetical protein
LIIDEQKEVVWLLLKDDPPYFFVGDTEDRNVIYSANTGEFLGYRMKLIDTELEVYRVKR